MNRTVYGIFCLWNILLMKMSWNSQAVKCPVWILHAHEMSCLWKVISMKWLDHWNVLSMKFYSLKPSLMLLIIFKVLAFNYNKRTIHIPYTLHKYHKIWNCIFIFPGRWALRRETSTVWTPACTTSRAQTEGITVIFAASTLELRLLSVQEVLSIFVK